MTVRGSGGSSGFVLLEAFGIIRLGGLRLPERHQDLREDLLAVRVGVNYIAIEPTRVYVRLAETWGQRAALGRLLRRVGHPIGANIGNAASQDSKEKGEYRDSWFGGESLSELGGEGLRG